MIIPSVSTYSILSSFRVYAHSQVRDRFFLVFLPRILLHAHDCNNRLNERHGLKSSVHVQFVPNALLIKRYGAITHRAVDEFTTLASIAYIYTSDKFTSPPIRLHLPRTDDPTHFIRVTYDYIISQSATASNVSPSFHLETSDPLSRYFSRGRDFSPTGGAGQRGKILPPPVATSPTTFVLLSPANSVLTRLSKARR